MLRLNIESANELDKTIETHIKDGKNVIVLFTGSKVQNSKSWCSDCVVAEPVIEAVLEKRAADDKMVFLTVFVGDMSTWKCAENQYRKHPKYAINCVPTLINISKNKRLEEGGCADSGLVEKLLIGDLATAKTVRPGTCDGGACRLMK